MPTSTGPASSSAAGDLPRARIGSAERNPAMEHASLRPLLYLLNDDDAATRDLRRLLESEGFRLRSFENSKGLLSEALNEQPAVFLLDLSSSPRSEGLELCRRIRSTLALAGTPILVLSSTADEVERIAGLDAGADDYLSKPFGPRELVARIKAISRRFGAAKKTDVIALGELAIDTAAVTTTLHGNPVPLTITEFRLLEFLARHPGRVFSRQRLLELVWEGAENISPRAVDVYVRRIREKIEEDPEAPRFLKTIRGAGYRFDIPE